MMIDAKSYSSFIGFLTDTAEIMQRNQRILFRDIYADVQSLDTIGDAIGYSGVYIGSIIRGNRRIIHSNLFIKLAEVFRVDLVRYMFELGERFYLERSDEPAYYPNESRIASIVENISGIDVELLRWCIKKGLDGKLKYLGVFSLPLSLHYYGKIDIKKIFNPFIEPFTDNESGEDTMSKQSGRFGQKSYVDPSLREPEEEPEGREVEVKRTYLDNTGPLGGIVLPRPSEERRVTLTHHEACTILSMRTKLRVDQIDYILRMYNRLTFEEPEPGM